MIAVNKKDVAGAIHLESKHTQINENRKVGDENEEEPDLTSLTWLTELRNQNLTWPNSLNINAEDDNEKAYTTGVTSSEPGVKIKNKRSTKSKSANEIIAAKNDTQPQQLAQKRSTPAERYKIFLDKVKRDLKEYQESAEKYQTDSCEKPPFNYSHIIGMAMLEQGRVTLQQICAWIEAQFAFFRVRKKWNNSIRHNLSLHHCFRKINRNKYEKGKGGYWELGIDPKKCDRKRIRNRKSNKGKLKNINATKAIETTEPFASDKTEQQVDNPQQPSELNESQETFFDYGEYCVTSTVADAQQVNQLYVTEPSEAPQYHLGTIIISTAPVDGSDLSYIQPHQFQLNNMSFHDDDRPIYSDFSAAYDVLERIQETDSLQPRANVIVEQVIPSTIAANRDLENECSGEVDMVEQFVPEASAVVTVSNSTTTPAISEQNSMYFTPYIDGIEEAFQYLRSIDQNNREDILDNILDISVSDY